MIGRPRAGGTASLMNAGSAEESQSRGGRTGAMAAGMLMALLALFMAPMSLRETCTSINRRHFVLDELRLEHFSEGSGGDSSASLEGRLASTGERYVFDHVSVVGLDRLRELSRENRVVGYRTAVRYLPKQEGFWAAVDWANQFRVRTPEDFDHGFPAGLVIANIVFAAGGVLLIRRGAGLPRQAGTTRGPTPDKKPRRRPRP
jgi:hypothetical protein